MQHQNWNFRLVVTRLRAGRCPAIVMLFREWQLCDCGSWTGKEWALQDHDHVAIAAYV